jgi:hypothetical protein
MLGRRGLYMALLAVAIEVSALAAASGAMAAGGPLIPGGAYGATGVTGPSGEPSAAFRYVALDANGETLLERIETDGGRVDALKRLGGSWALPAVTISGRAGGLTADGDTLVLIEPRYDRRAESTSLLVVDTSERNMHAETLVLDGRFSFDAISPDGRLLYLVEYPDPRNALDYRVRAFDLNRDRFRPGAVVDPEEPGEQMTGQPLARQTSPDGRWAYTLYGGGEETFIHALDTQEATAVCVDLEQFPPRAMYLLGLDVGAGGWITVSKGGDPVATVNPRTFKVHTLTGNDEAVGSPGEAGGGANEGGGGVPWWAAAAAVILACFGAIAALRLRRRRPEVDDEELERLVGDVPPEVREERTRDPVA